MPPPQRENVHAYWQSQLQFILKLKRGEFYKTLGVYAEVFPAALKKYTVCHEEKQKARAIARTPNGQGKKSPYTPQLRLVLNLLHYQRKLLAWDLYLMWHIDENTIRNLIDETEVDLDKSLEGTISMLTKEERLKLAEQYNLLEHH